MSEENANGVNEPIDGGAPSSEATVPRADYERLLIEATTAKEKAALFDDLLKDPEFLEFLDKDGTPATPAPKPSVTPPAAPKGGDTQVLQSQIAELTSKLESLQQSYATDKMAFMRMESDKLIDTMSTDKVNYPFFGEKEVRETMATLLEQGRAANMADAYRLATYDKSVATGRDQVVRKKGVVTLPLSQGTGTPLPASGGRRSLHDILNDAMDKTGLVLTEEE